MTAAEAHPKRGWRSSVFETSRSPHAKLCPVPIGAVQLEDTFWAPRLRLLREKTLPSQYEACEATGRIDNFRRASGKKQVGFQGRYYNDSDVYKWLEAASFALASGPDAKLERHVNLVIQEIADAQFADGYLNTYFTFEHEAERWTDTTKHELYCAGHLIQAAVAHHRATGERTLLDVAVHLADYICASFGPQARHSTDGHPEIEMALVELYRETGAPRYLEEARFMLDMRGQRPPALGGAAYVQDHLPVREQFEIVGHAVRAAYLAAGMSDVALETGEPALLRAVDAQWQSAFERKGYLTGGLGAHFQGESFGAEYELPNERAYAETCAAIAGLMWNARRLAHTGDAKYADWLETALYNGALSGISLDGTGYFYTNPLANRGEHRRQPFAYYSTACCPPNIARLLASVPGYLYSTTADGVWVHLYAASRVRATLAAGEMALRVETRYPWDGQVEVVVETAPERECEMVLRLPNWCAQPRIAVNGKGAQIDITPGQYAGVRRSWRRGDVLRLDLPMPVRRVASHPRVLANTGRVALTRGPLVYALEGVDNPAFDVWDAVLPEHAALTAAEAPELLGGVVTVRGEAAVEETRWDGPLYQPPGAAPAASRRPAQITAIPYFAWANREPSPMQVWLRRV